MTEQLARQEETGFDWYDLTNPSEAELMQVAAAHQLHEALVHDCMQPDHLPKYETIDTYSFIIFRIYTHSNSQEADTVQELTDKIAVFFSDDFLITIHKDKQEFINALSEQVKQGKCTDVQALLNALIYACLNTYEQPLASIAKSIDYFEEVVFLRPKRISLLKALYYLRRQTELIKRMFILSHEIIDIIDADPGNVHTRETRDQYIRLRHMFEALSDNIHQLLNVYFSAASQRTNEIMRVLTVFSAFFLPLTFIVGVYGMNFDFMPELRWKLGYPGILAFMGLITLIIYLWFRRKKWL